MPNQKNIISEIVAISQSELAKTKILTPYKTLEREVENLPPTRNFKAALLNQNRYNVIAELKSASPSKGIIRANLEVEDLAIELEKNNSACLSILTEKNFFLGSLDNLKRARKVVNLPLLRKDFIYDEYQILEARLAGADAILLIMAMLTPQEFKHLYHFAKSLNLDVLAEAHTEYEVQTLLDSGADIIGINARNLATFETSMELVIELLHKIPNEIIKVAESAITSNDDLKLLYLNSANAFLIGETLMRSTNVGEKLCQLIAR